MAWMEFAACAALILLSGSRLSRYCDAIAEKTGAGRTWIGLLLLATVTSLPELFTVLSAATVAHAPDIAAGAILGSCVFNLALIGIADLIEPRSILAVVQRGHVLSGALGLLLVGLALAGFTFDGAIQLPGLWFGPSAPVILAAYLLGMRALFRVERERMEAEPESPSGVHDTLSMRSAWTWTAVHSCVVVGCGIWLPFAGERIAAETGLGETFVGNLMIAAATSLPEVVTSYAAVRLGSPDMAVGNLLGSNIFNVACLALGDLVFTRGPLLPDVSRLHAMSGGIALLMTGVCILGVVLKPRRTLGPLSGPGAALLLLYLVNAWLVYSLGLPA